jgi:hypothetical protein
MTHTLEEVERVAKGLTKAQREALFGGKIRGSTKPNLVTIGLLKLVPREQKPGSQPRFRYVETKLGLAVRDYLKAEER